MVGMTLPRTAWVQLTYPWCIKPQNTALLSGVAVLTPALLTQPSTKPCELWLHARVLYLSFVTMKPHCLQHAVPWSLDTRSTQRSPVHRMQMHGASNRDTHLYPPRNNSLVYLTTATYVRRIGRQKYNITRRALTLRSRRKYLWRPTCYACNPLKLVIQSNAVNM